MCPSEGHSKHSLSRTPGDEGSSATAVELEELRPLMFSIAYRMLGSACDAEDIVQEAYLRLEKAEQAGTTIKSVKSWLSTVVTRLSIDHLRLARVQREQYPGDWLPEPVLTGGGLEEDLELSDSISQAVLILLESLSPVERAVFLLHDVFDLQFSEISEIVDRREDNCRQLAVRARRHVDEGKPRFESSRRRREELAGRFFAACQDGDLDGLTDLLAADVGLHGDGGGKAPALAHPIGGRSKVAKALIGFVSTANRLGLEMRLLEVNAQPGGAFYDQEGRLVNIVSLDIGADGIDVVRSIVNPDKLNHLGPVADVRGLLRGVGNGPGS